MGYFRDVEPTCCYSLGGSTAMKDTYIGASETSSKSAGNEAHKLNL